MRPTVLLATIAAFGLAIVTFSRAYNAVLRFFEEPTEAKLVNIVVSAVALIAVLMVLGLIMYATERRLGNVKVKNALFERLLGYPAEPTGQPAAPARKRKEKHAK